MSMNLITVLYLVASVCFIQALKGLSHPTSSRRGNLFGMLGMGIAVLTTLGLIFKLGSELAGTGIGYVVVGLLIGGSVGTVMAKRVEMTKMPELVAFMHSMIGLAAVFIAIAAVVEPQSLGIVEQMGQAIPAGNRLELFLGAAIGAITFSGSVIAFGKLSGKYKFRLFQGAPVVFKGQHMVNLAVGLNCALGAKDLRPYLEELSSKAETFVSAHPNAGLPNAFGEYDESPAEMAAVVEEFASSGFLNIIGGCCGTTPAHIQAIAEAVSKYPPRVIPDIPKACRLSGLEPFTIDRSSLFVNVGERTNITGYPSHD